MRPLIRPFIRNWGADTYATRIVCCALVLALLSGCGWFGNSRTKGPRLAQEVARLPELDLQPAATLSGASVKDLVASEEEVLAAYRSVYGKISDVEQNQALGQRLADLELSRAELLSAEGDSGTPFAGAVELYEGLLASAVEAEDRDTLLYQLAQSNDMAGNGAATERYLDELIADYPDSSHRLEARFRRGEMRFSKGDFAGAAEDYADVTAAGDDTKYWLHASYMLGWSQFKLSDLEAAADEFYRVVDVTAKTSDPTSENNARQRLQVEVRDDALRVLLLTLNYEKGAESLAADMRERGRPDWQYLVYDRLAGDYAEQERYIDSVAAWQTFVDENPLDHRAPSATVSIIDIFRQADFPSEIVPKKEEFVARFGVRSEFWKVHKPESRADYIDTLHSYLGELSRLRHAQAQQSGLGKDFLAAADYYEQTIETFPEDPKTGDTLFLLGDLYTDAKMAEPALAAYRRLAEDYPDHPKAAEAGYSSLLALDELGRTSAPDSRANWQEQKLAAQIAFAETFPEDPRASAVQAAAADELFANGRYADAIDLANQLLAKQSVPDEALRDTARLIVGHGSMELKDFATAELAYSEYLSARASFSGTDPTTDTEVQEALLASVYKQGEAAEKALDYPTALHHYLRLAQLGPGSDIAALAHYDSIAMMETAGDTGKITELLSSFRNLYPNDPRATQVPGRLASLYEKQESYSAAADEYLKVAAASQDPEQRRQAQFLAAELYLKDGNKTAALREFARYTDNYERPADDYMAALDLQDTLLEEQGASRTAIWVQKVNARERAGKKASERMNFLAAQASLQLANIDRQEFDSLRLTQPLKKSLKAKQKSLKRTINAYKQVLDYGVADFVTAANFQIADMYVQLSQSIMDSSRPPGLSALELEQYEILLEEQAYPFEEQAIDLHEVNLHRLWSGTSDEWTERSLAALRVLMPGRFDKTEVQVAYVNAIH